MTPGRDITGLLTALQEGDASAGSRLAELVYQDLHALAERCMRRERVDHTLQPTALVNELFVRLLRGQPVAFESRAHFFATASQVMRRILVDHARQRAAGKRPPGERRAPLHEALISPGLPLELVLVLDDALTRLADFDPRHARLVEMRYFGGLTEMEIASAMGVSVRTVRRDWKAARAWLLGEMSGPVA